MAADPDETDETAKPDEDAEPETDADDTAETDEVAEPAADAGKQAETDETADPDETEVGDAVATEEDRSADIESAPNAATEEPVAASDGPATPVAGIPALTYAPPGAAPWEAPTAEPEAPTAHASDPWSGITWSAADQPAPWTAAPTAADDDSLGLDDDQRRWLLRDVTAVESIGPGYGSQLDAIGVRTLQDLLLRGATRRGRQEIADTTGISGKLILRWVNNADLFRIRGVGSQYADLLEAAGVDTVVELALRRPENLAARLATTNELRSLVRQVPTETQVADWVRQARELPRVVAY